MNNWAILGPNKLLDKSFRRNARRLVRETVNRNWFKNAYRASNRNYVAINIGGNLVGFALINKNGRNLKGDVRIRLIGANKGRGIGRALIERIIDNARARGLKTVTLESVPEARGFYNKMGFLPIGIGNNMRYYISSKRKLPSHPTPKRPASSSPTSARRRAGKTPHP